MTKPDLDELERVADAATEGGWHRQLIGPPGSSYEIRDNLHHRAVATSDEEDAQHIATFDPPTVKALIARVRELEQDYKGLCSGLGYCNESPMHGPGYEVPSHADLCSLIQAERGTMDDLCYRFEAQDKQLQAWREAFAASKSFHSDEKACMGKSITLSYAEEKARELDKEAGE